MRLEALFTLGMRGDTYSRKQWARARWQASAGHVIAFRTGSTSKTRLAGAINPVGTVACSEEPLEPDLENLTVTGQEAAAATPW